MRRRSLAPVLVTAALAVTGCGNDGDAVFVLGDSITALGDRQLRDTLTGYELNISASVGATIEEQMDAARVGAASAPDQVIINLGTNDVLDGRTGAEAAASLDRMVALFADVPCVFVVTINANLDQRGNRPTAEIAALDQAIEAIPDRHDNVEVVAWNEIQGDAAEESGNPAALTTDGVHPDDPGQQRLAEVYADALGGCGPAL